MNTKHRTRNTTLVVSAAALLVAGCAMTPGEGEPGVTSSAMREEASPDNAAVAAASEGSEDVLSHIAACRYRCTCEMAPVIVPECGMCEELAAYVVRVGGCGTRTVHRSCEQDENGRDVCTLSCDDTEDLRVNVATCATCVEAAQALCENQECPLGLGGEMTAALDQVTCVR